MGIISMVGARVKKLRRGFTLAELLTVIAIMAILASIVAPVTLQYISQTQERADQVYTSDIAKMADSCVISLKNRSVQINSYTVANELKVLYGNDIPYEIGYVQSGQIIGSTSNPTLSNVEGISSGATNYVVIYIDGTSLNLYLVKDGTEIPDQRQYRLIAA